MSLTIRIGTRGSALALWQARAVAAALPAPYVGHIIPVHSSGDWHPGAQEAPLPPDVGGKALFAKELEEALLAGDIDCAVHSVKDMAAVLPNGLMLAAVLSRDEARDALIGPEPCVGMRLGSVSPRRAAFAQVLWPGVHIVPLRGNVDTRLAKWEKGMADSLILSATGLMRLGLDRHITRLLTLKEMVPAAGQGAIGIEARTDTPLLPLLESLNAKNDYMCVKAERAATCALGGNCHSAIGAHAVLEEKETKMRLYVALGAKRVEVLGSAQEGHILAQDAAKFLVQDADSKS